MDSTGAGAGSGAAGVCIDGAGGAQGEFKSAAGAGVLFNPRSAGAVGAGGLNAEAVSDCKGFESEGRFEAGEGVKSAA